MGLLDRWTKKKEEEQLQKNSSVKTNDIVLPKKEKTEKIKVKTEEKKVEVKQLEKTGNGNAYKVLLKPLVTEKSAVMGSLNKYAFLVHKDTNKNEISKAVKAVYGVKPIAVNVINSQGRSVRFGRAMGRRSDFKKAIVTLAKGDTITVHEGV